MLEYPAVVRYFRNNVNLKLFLIITLSCSFSFTYFTSLKFKKFYGVVWIFWRRTSVLREKSMLQILDVTKTFDCRSNKNQKMRLKRRKKRKLTLMEKRKMAMTLKKRIVMRRQLNKHMLTMTPRKRFVY